jgi:hypothetical protein
MIELYHNDMSVCAQKARFALAEKRLKWEGTKQLDERKRRRGSVEGKINHRIGLM